MVSLTFEFRLIEALSFLQEQIELFVSTNFSVVTKQLGEYEKTRIDYDSARVYFESLKVSGVWLYGCGVGEREREGGREGERERYFFSVCL